MRFLKLSATIFAISLFLMACNTNRPAETASINPPAHDESLTEVTQAENDLWAKDNFDLQRAGNLLERANNAEEFENLLNSNDGVNNLDLNGDGYVDYISVSEFDDRGDNQRGLSLFSRFGPDLIQEIATIIFNRDDRNSRGARILLTGNEQIYGDDNYYETNWLDRSLGIATWMYGDRPTYYRSPYYYDNYPDGYQLYQVVETPLYRTRMTRIYPSPVFILTANPAITQIKIKSPHHDKWMSKIHYKLAKPNNEQKEFKAKNPNRPEFVPVKGDRRQNEFNPNNPPKGDPKAEKENVKPSNPAKAVQNEKLPNPEKGGNGKGKKN